MIKRKTFIRQKRGECYFCQGGVLPDWKNPEILLKFVSERGKILAKLRSGVCAKHQRRLARAIKRARYLALLPFITQVK
ncbi:MAG: 30S ribosomal protein S18 [Patescibacteria group bacterium]